MSSETRKRSRFDQTEPDPTHRSSRFDRRSRSPTSRQDSEYQRSRSPISQSSASPRPKSNAAAAAIAAAAKISQQLQSRAAPSGRPEVKVQSATPVKSPDGDDSKDSGAILNTEIYQQDGDYIKDIEVNDLRNRYTLTKGQTQKMIKEDTGADVTTRGSYLPDKSMATAANPPLYLHVTSTTREGLEQAIQKIEALMQQDLPNLIDERRFRRREPDPVERDEHGRRKWPEEKIPVDLEPIPGFNLRAQVVGTSGSNVKHIQSGTGCRVQIKGRGSGFTEYGTNVESDEPMYLHVAGPDPTQVQTAKELCVDLLTHIRTQYHEFKERGPRGGYGAGGGAGNGGGYHQHGGGSSASYGHGQDSFGGRRQDSRNSNHYSGVSEPAQFQPRDEAGNPISMEEYQAQYKKWVDESCGGVDPYAGVEGGYLGAIAQYSKWQASQQSYGHPAQGSPTYDTTAYNAYTQQAGSPAAQTPYGLPGQSAGSPAGQSPYAQPGAALQSPYNNAGMAAYSPYGSHAAYGAPGTNGSHSTAPPPPPSNEQPPPPPPPSASSGQYGSSSSIPPPPPPGK